MPSSKVINISHFRSAKQDQIRKTLPKIQALEKVEARKLSPSEQYNYEFYCLVDLFLHEHYPEAFWKFNVWLEQINKE